MPGAEKACERLLSGTQLPFSDPPTAAPPQRRLRSPAAFGRCAVPCVKSPKAQRLAIVLPLERHSIAGAMESS